jgi:transposase-like protein
VTFRTGDMGNTFRLCREVLMPWRETSVMEERLRFVARLLEGEGMSEVCRAFGISRKTGYKIFNRYKDDGLEALTDRSRRPVRYLNQLPDPVEAMICSPQTREALLGCQEDQGTARQTAGRRCAHSGKEHRTRRTRSSRPCEPGPQEEPGEQGRRHAAIGGTWSQRSLVRRLQGRVQARHGNTVTP